MNRAQKEAAVAELATELGEAQAIFAVDYRGISVPQAAELRSELRNADTAFRVVKNRLTTRAADQAGTEPLKDWLEGPTALALVKGDAAAAAKTLTKLGTEFEVLEYKGGLLDGEVLDADNFKAIAKLPTRDTLNAQLAGIVASPITGLVRGLGSMISGLALQLGQIAEQGLVTGKEPEPEPEPAKEEAPAAEEEGKENEPEETSSEAPDESSASPGTEASAGGSAGEAEQPPDGDGEAVSPAPEAEEEPAAEAEAPADEEKTEEPTPEPEADAPAEDEAPEEKTEPEASADADDSSDEDPTEDTKEDN